MFSLREVKKNSSIFALIIILFFTSFQVWQQIKNNNQVLGESDDRGFEVAKVKRVIDGDTIELSDGRKVRYIGIDTPETKDPRVGVECFGKEASQRNKELVEGKTIYLEKDVSETDRYSRLLRYVWLKETLVNKQLVTEGYAFASSFPPDIARQDELRKAEQNARTRLLGLWGECDLNDAYKINETIRMADEQLENAVLGASEEAELKDGCVIKGNISSNGKLYHLPECSSYDSVKIDEGKGEQWFCNEADATAAGWQRAGNCN